MYNYPELSEDDAEFLNGEGWREPRHSYVLLRGPQRHLGKGGAIIKDGTVTLPMGGTHKKIKRIEFYIRKGFRILKWGNFPKPDSREWKYHGDEEDNAYLVLDRQLAQHLNRHGESARLSMYEKRASEAEKLAAQKQKEIDELRKKANEQGSGVSKKKSEPSSGTKPEVRTGESSSKGEA